MADGAVIEAGGYTSALGVSECQRRTWGERGGTADRVVGEDKNQGARFSVRVPAAQ